jgi:ankyrin repeat protein
MQTSTFQLAFLSPVPPEDHANKSSKYIRHRKSPRSASKSAPAHESAKSPESAIAQAQSSRESYLETLSHSLMNSSRSITYGTTEGIVGSETIGRSYNDKLFLQPQRREIHTARVHSLADYTTAYAGHLLTNTAMNPLKPTMNYYAAARLRAGQIQRLWAQQERRRKVRTQNSPYNDQENKLQDDLHNGLLFLDQRTYQKPESAGKLAQRREQLNKLYTNWSKKNKKPEFMSKTKQHEQGFSEDNHSYGQDNNESSGTFALLSEEQISQMIKRKHAHSHGEYDFMDISVHSPASHNSRALTRINSNLSLHGHHGSNHSNHGSSSHTSAQLSRSHSKKDLNHAPHPPNHHNIARLIDKLTNPARRGKQESTSLFNLPTEGLGQAEISPESAENMGNGAAKGEEHYEQLDWYSKLIGKQPRTIEQVKLQEEKLKRRRDMQESMLEKEKSAVQHALNEYLDAKQRAEELNKLNKALEKSREREKLEEQLKKIKTKEENKRISAEIQLNEQKNAEKQREMARITAEEAAKELREELASAAITRKVRDNRKKEQLALNQAILEAEDKKLLALKRFNESKNLFMHSLTYAQAIKHENSEEKQEFELHPAENTLKSHEHHSQSYVQQYNSAHSSRKSRAEQNLAAVRQQKRERTAILTAEIKEKHQMAQRNKQNQTKNIEMNTNQADKHKLRKEELIIVEKLAKLAKKGALEEFSGLLQSLLQQLSAKKLRFSPADLLNLRDSNGSTCLYTAVWYGHSEIAEFCLEHGANPNQINHRQNSPLHLACDRSHFGIIKQLLLRGCNPLLLNSSGKLCFQMLTSGESFEMLLYLRQTLEDIKIELSEFGEINAEQIQGMIVNGMEGNGEERAAGNNGMEQAEDIPSLLPPSNPNGLYSSSEVKHNLDHYLFYVNQYIDKHIELKNKLQESKHKMKSKVLASVRFAKNNIVHNIENINYDTNHKNITSTNNEERSGDTNSRSITARLRERRHYNPDHNEEPQQITSTSS